MAAATMFDSGYQAFCDVIDVLLIKVATLLLNWVQIGRKMIERHQFFEIQDGGSTMLNSGYKAFFYTIGVLFIKVATCLPTLVKIGH